MAPAIEFSFKKYLSYLLQVDTFTFEAVHLDELQKITIGHDGAGHGAGWFVEKVIVKATEGEGKDKESVFYCGQWLDDHEGDKKTEREITCTGNQLMCNVMKWSTKYFVFPYRIDVTLIVSNLYLS